MDKEFFYLIYNKNGMELTKNEFELIKLIINFMRKDKND